MAFETEDFMIDFIKQLNLRNMDDATRARLDDLQKKKVATKKQDAWDPTKPLPDYTAAAYGGTASVNDLNDLYLKMVVIMRDIQMDRDMRENDPTKKFLDTFYGAGKAIEPYEAKPIPAPHRADSIRDYINANLQDLNFAIGMKESDLKKLADALDTGTYTTDAKALKIFETFIEKVSSFHYTSSKPLPGTPPPELADTSNLGQIKEEISKPVDPTVPQLTQFESGMGKLFDKLVSNDKLREKFTSKDSEGDVTYWLNKGLGETNYKEGDHALTPKYKNRKTFWNKAKDNLKENYVETVGKLNKKHQRHIYSTNARYVVEELIKKGVKPTDGTEKILETFDAINGNLPNPVQKQLKWVKETMTKMKGTDFFKDALKDGTQMRQLVSEIIKAAAHDDKKEEAKVALETLAVMRYTLTTSSIRDKLRKTEVSIFSDKNLSWNKNEGMQFVTNAIDGAIKYGMLALFEVGNFAKNSIRQYGLKFKKGKDRLGKRVTDSNEYDGAEKQEMMEELFAFWDFVNSSANTKDYNIFRMHKDVQKDADKVDPTTGKKKIHQRFEDYYASHSIGR